MIYHAITNLINAAIYLLSVAERQAQHEANKQMARIEELHDKIDAAASAADKATSEGYKCARLRDKLEGLSD